MDYSSLRNFKDFLQLYNVMSETCFLRCITSLYERDLTQDEAQCVDNCAQKHVNVNHKIMQVYMEVQPEINQRRIDEMNKAQAELEASQAKALQVELEAAKTRENLAEEDLLEMLAPIDLNV
ncbi:mitochondrial import inner membrane translocase subunit Tim10 B [Anabrus simplex]|uniref:mitochondrial import inner membrane translocase subunit Tim10 B n=1 Tax=Anabrus simplex TaxID=316456 RepID=UPI0034DCD57A